MADKVLAEKAWQRVKSKDAYIPERVNALLVTNMMKGKVKLGMDLKRRMKKKIKKMISFGRTIRNIGRLIQGKKPQSIDKAIKLALSTAKKTFN